MKNRLLWIDNWQPASQELTGELEEEECFNNRTGAKTWNRLNDKNSKHGKWQLHQHCTETVKSEQSTDLCRESQ